MKERFEKLENIFALMFTNVQKISTDMDKIKDNPKDNANNNNKGPRNQ